MPAITNKRLWWHRSGQAVEVIDISNEDLYDTPCTLQTKTVYHLDRIFEGVNQNGDFCIGASLKEVDLGNPNMGWYITRFVPVFPQRLKEIKDMCMLITERWSEPV